MRFAPLRSVRTRLILSHMVVGVLSVLIILAVQHVYAVREGRRARDTRMEWRGGGRPPGAFTGAVRPGPPPTQPGQPGQPGPPPTQPVQPGPPPPRPPRFWGIPRFLMDSLPAGLAFAAAMCILVGLWVGRLITRPLSVLSAGARALHATHFSHRIPLNGEDEFAEVAASMNEMAERVGAQVATLEEDARRRRQVLADVAHELRSPVATLKAMTSALLDGVAEQPERRAEALGRMRDAADRMERLVTDLLEVSRLDLHEVPLVRATVDLRELAEDAVYTHAREAERAGIRLAPVEDGPPVPVEADRLRLAQALDNLVENAISYAGEGAEVRIRVEADPPGFVVEDTGAGIAARHLPFLFDAFYRADAARTPGGTHSGLGLRIARGLVEAHGGTLTIESEEGHGVRAVIALPAPHTTDR